MSTTFDICQYIDDLKDRVRAEKDDPIDALAAIRTILKVVTTAEAAIDPIARQAAEKYEKDFVHNGIKWQQRPGSRRYDYKQVRAWAVLKEQLEAEELRAKRAAELLSRGYGAKLDTDTGYVVTDDGEVIGEPAQVSVTKASLVMAATK
jgi:hypothetical protein